MFITLKTYKNQDASGMEQVASRNADSSAAGGASEIRENHAVPIKRSACLACKIKKVRICIRSCAVINERGWMCADMKWSKVRCTGQRQRCDRCRSRAIRCIMPTLQKKVIRKAGLLDGLTQGATRSPTDQSVEAKRLQEDATINQPLTAEQTMTGVQDTAVYGINAFDATSHPANSRIRRRSRLFLQL
ncbi:hypothetical protein CFAM422_006097 [Trichoderma lentiforme]|uniref:Zn(2)-C6 fungal-type domain-containing protein n=1 Tax=Trichoderma lentiforme TaxID=1567552 RepID=A0A9P4XFU1_9HYPO|nr:hypothetical protein CFAM422_006097 [Trichoderma lentiforme]